MKEANVVQLSKSDYNALIQKINDCEKDKKRLIESFQFLNNKVEEYNKKFVELNSTNSTNCTVSTSKSK